MDNETSLFSLVNYRGIGYANGFCKTVKTRLMSLLNRCNKVAAGKQRISRERLFYRCKTEYDGYYGPYGWCLEKKKRNKTGVSEWMCIRGKLK